MPTAAVALLEPTLTVADLLLRWKCSKSQVYVVIATPTFPRGTKVGQRRVWTLSAIYAWEKKYLPELHAQVEEKQEDEEWQLLREQIQRQREVQPQKPRRRAVRRRA